MFQKGSQASHLGKKKRTNIWCLHADTVAGNDKMCKNEADFYLHRNGQGLTPCLITIEHNYK